MKNSKYTILPIFLTVFIDLIGVGIVIPTLPALFLDTNLPLLPLDSSFGQRTFLLGILSGIFSFATFLGAPLLGGLSDRMGRKKILELTLIGTAIGYVLFAIGIMTYNLPLLFFSRFISGFAAGNISIAMSAIADISTAKDKAKNFGLIGMSFGLGFILGPFLGGKLADPNIVSWFTIATPFWFAAFLAIVNSVIVFFYFKETLKEKVTKKISIFTGFINLKKAFYMKNLRIMFIITFLYIFGFNFFAQFYQVFLIEKYNFTPSQTGDFFAYIGLWIAITQGLITRFVAKKYNPKQVLTITLLFLSISLLIITVPNSVVMLLIVQPFVAIFQGLTFPNSNAIISNLADEKSQGEILGINQSIQAIGMAIPPLLGGIVVAWDIRFPIIIASLVVFVSWIIFMFFFKNTQQKFHEV